MLTYPITLLAPADLIAKELYAAETTGANYLSSASTNFDFGDVAFSKSIWFYPTIGQTTYVVSKMGASGARGYGMVVQTSGSSRLRCFMSTDGTALNEAASIGTITLNTWNLGVLAYDPIANLLKSSLNGAAYTTEPHNNGPFVDTSVDFAVGRRLDAGSPLYFTGRADSLSVWNKALTEAEVTTLYNSGVGQSYGVMSKVGLQNYYKLNEETGSRIDFHGTDDLTDNSSVGRATGKILD